MCGYSRVLEIIKNPINYLIAAVTLHAVYRIGIQPSSDIYTRTRSLSAACTHLTDKKDRTKRLGYKDTFQYFHLTKNIKMIEYNIYNYCYNKY